jgi:hypothetical protein
MLLLSALSPSVYFTCVSECKKQMICKKVIERSVQTTKEKENKEAVWEGRKKLKEYTVTSANCQETSGEGDSLIGLLFPCQTSPQPSKVKEIPRLLPERTL